MKLSIIYFSIFQIFFFSIILSVQAQTMYVSDKLSITVRTGKDTSHRIIALIESGQEVETLEKSEEWALVRLKNGKEGWVLSRYLTTDIPKSIQLESLQIKYKDVVTQNELLMTQNDKLKSNHEKLNDILSEKEKALNNLQIKYDSLRTESADFLDLKKNYEKASLQLISQTKKAEELEKIVEKLQIYQYIKWFLAGSGVLLLGFIFGFASKSRRRQSSLL